MRLISAVILMIAVLACPGFSSAADTTEGMGNCPKGTFHKVFNNYLSTLHNVFPMKFSGVTVLNYKALEDYDDSAPSVICVCRIPYYPYIRVGFPFHMWEPADAVEVVQQPWCSPTLGSMWSLNYSKRSIGDESNYATQKDRTASAQAHLVHFPLWYFLGLFVDSACFQAATGLDYVYMTELDPLWQNDLWSSVLSPDASLFANMVAQAACTIDCATATAGFPLDYFFWCAGCWGGSFPLSKNASSVDYLQANAAIGAKFVAKMHREAILWLTSGPMMIRGYCQAFPFPVWKKTQYNFLLLYPSRNQNRQPIGRTAHLWGVAKSYPYNPNYVFGVYRIRDCCAF